MRIITGEFGGRIIESPKGHRTHPMSEKVRGALFSMLGDITGLRVLDGFSGSGALALEAISRGAEFVVAVESSVKAHTTIKKNVRALGAESRVKVVRANIAGWSARSQELFDVVLLDPPYDYLQVELIAKLSKHVNSGGMLVLSWPGDERPLKIKECDLIKSGNYGDATLQFYRKH
jgi:16S rRNA (guanine966-N2)-methyltransferase